MTIETVVQMHGLLVKMSNSSWGTEMTTTNGFNPLADFHATIQPHRRLAQPSRAQNIVPMPELELISALPGHAEPAWQVSFNPTLPLLASCSTDKTFRIYSYALPSAPPSDASSAEPTGFLSKNSAKPSFQLVKTVKTEHKRTIRSIAWAPSGRTLATGSFDSTVALWEETDDSDDDDSQEEDEDEDVDMDQGGMQGGVYKPGKEGAGQNWECVTTLEGHESECKGVGFSYDGGLLGSCSRDKSVWVWEGESRGRRGWDTSRSTARRGRQVDWSTA